ncbi:DUF3300 domain-containing protein [Alteromonas sp. KUL106]|uniref:DUF3300 domain-containing protein n=1 Tax=Alteromonas sp. KUL106 TaxID=2480799 RepID=UPI0012E4D64B|nr:DUF3300 domain-containing protein [Alteromonas sp. KUL106]GFD68898.1 hypothetical protein KUL106_21610 [Alteromonas sp. KUL106]
MKNIALTVIVALSSAATLPALAQTSANVTQIGASIEQYSDAQLDSVLAPIALYPDTLLTHILIASTYPLDVVAADRWRQSNKHLTAEQVENVLTNVDWDPSVKALAPFTDLLNTMASDLEWLQQLGDNVLIDQSRVLDRVQVLRQHAHNTGNLVTNDYIEVETEREKTREIIYIEPRQREVVYVPYYDPHVVYGHWWHATSPVRWRHHVNYHHHSNVFWSPSLRLSTFFFFGSVHWHNRHVVIHRDPVRRYYHGSPRKRVSNREYRRWEHNTVHRRARYSNHVVHSAPSRYDKAGAMRIKPLSDRQVRTMDSSPRYNEKYSGGSVSRTGDSKPIKRTIEPKKVTALREHRVKTQQGTVKHKPSIEHALKRNQKIAKNNKPTKESTLAQLKRDKPARLSPNSKVHKQVKQNAGERRLPEHNTGKGRVERASPVQRSVAKASSKPMRSERNSNDYKRSNHSGSQKQIAREGRSVAKGHYEKR